MPQSIYLGIGSGSHAVQTAKVMVEFEKFAEHRPIMVVVVGDVNSTLPAAWYVRKSGFHVRMLRLAYVLLIEKCQEINRLITDTIADFVNSSPVVMKILETKEPEKIE